MGSSRVNQNHESRAARLWELAALFLKLGATAFGGPAVHIALLENEVVRRRQWLTHAAFLDLLGATNLIPGPNSTELAIHIGLRRAGAWGLIVAGVCFVVPAFLIVLACAWFYTRYARSPQVAGVLYGVKPVVLAIVVQALYRLAPSAMRSRPLATVAVATCIAALAGMHELLLLLVAGVVVAAMQRLMREPRTDAGAKVNAIVPMFPLALLTTSAAAGGFSIGKLFLVFLKIGAVLYGSGYVLLAFLKADLVERRDWMTESQLLDAIAIGQVTPGPLFTTATFIGYVLAGPPGACLATLGIFLPSFVFVALSAPLIPRIRASPTAGAFLDGVNAASLSLMAAVTLQLLGAALVDWPTMLIGLVGAAALLLWKANPIWLILGAGVVGLVMH
jgi:chromate transporter